MKQLLGAAIVLLGLALTTLLVLRIWGIVPVSLPTLLRSGATLAVLAVAVVLLLIVWGLFFVNPAKGYDQSQGNRAHPQR
jgi:hypothetical protein